MWFKRATVLLYGVKEHQSNQIAVCFRAPLIKVINSTLKKNCEIYWNFLKQIQNGNHKVVMTL